ncbi:porin [Cupriavidus sp. amp6]|uniref:porin n=1 Tax=Cupriavidus sp. amp6 TaxID=388051 RepID=UPI0004100D7C|nr:porin [Cupriavidus sp. amp6]
MSIMLARGNGANRRVAAATVLGIIITGPVQAQTSSGVTLYGIIDTMVRYSNNNAGDNNLAELTEGYFNGSRWGMRGNEALGGGLSAIFNLESGFDPTTGKSLQGTATANYGQQSTGGQGRLFGRQAWVGLNHDTLGKLTFGRQFTTAYDATSRFQPNGHPNLDAVTILNGYTGPRQDNMAKYFGQWGGLSAGAHYTFGEVAGQMKPSSSYGVSLGYKQGPVDVGGFWQQANALTTPEARKVWGLGGNYQWGIVKLTFGYLNNRFDVSPTRNDVFTGGFAVSATQALTLSVASHYDRQRNASGSRIMVTGVADYNLSKRTDVYAEVDFNRISGAYALPAFMGVKGSKVGGGIGLRHRF